MDSALVVQSILATGAILFLISTIVLAILGTIKKNKIGLFHLFLILPVTIIAGSAYLAMYLGLGTITLNGVTIQLARYVDWFITTPLLLISLITIGLPPSSPSRWTLIWMVVFLDMYMIITGALSAISQTSPFKWVWFVLSGLGLIGIGWLLYGSILKESKGSEPYIMLATYLFILWIGYPIVWILSPSGVNVIDFATENAYYLILDFLAKAVFGLFLFSELIFYNKKTLKLTP